MEKINIKKNFDAMVYARRVSKLTSMNEFVRKKIDGKELKKRLIKWMRMMVLASRVCRDAVQRYNDKINELCSFAHHDLLEKLEFADDNAKIKAEMMNFTSYFSQKSTVFLSKRARSILKSNNLLEREPAKLACIKNDLKKFSHMNFLNKLNSESVDKFIEACWLEEYESHRIITAQYDIPRHFYIVLTGSLACTFKNKDWLESNTICMIEKGMCFGDLPIMSESMNTSTLISRTNVQLLVIQRNDFLDIFINSKTNGTSGKSEKSTDNIDFLRSLELFKDWPLHLFEENFQSIKACFYKRNQIMTHDSSLSKYLYIVKSGYMSVWTKLDSKNSTAKNSNLKERISRDELETDESFFPKSDLLKLHHNDVLNFQDNSNLFKAKNEEERQRDIEAKMRLNGILSYFEEVKERDRMSKEVKKPELDVLRNKVIKWRQNGTIYCYRDKTNPKEPHSSHSRLSIIGASNEPKLLRLQNIYEQETFGLQDILFENQPPMQLISNGCECVLILKDFFIQNSPMEYLKHLRKIVPPFPEPNDLRKQYLNYMDWKQFTGNFYKETLSKMK